MNLEELRSVQNAERQKSGLQSLRESFYEDAGDYIASLKDRRQQAAAEAEDPFSSPEVSRLTDEIETAEEVVEAIYDRRMGKLLKRASLAASDMSVDEDGLTAEERELFSDLVDRIESNKTRVLDTLAAEGDGGDGGSPTGESPTGGSRSETGGSADDRRDGVDTDRTPEDETETVSAADAMGGGDGTPPDGPDPTPEPDGGITPEPSSGAGGGADGAVGEPGPGPANVTDPGTADGSDTGNRGGVENGGNGPEEPERVTVRITRDVGEIVGVDDREYDLSRETVVQLPAENADVLVEGDAAEPLE